LGKEKGNEFLTTRNMKKYRNIADAINRIINQIYKLDGRIFYYGREKYKAVSDSNSTGLYATVLGHAIRQIDSFCEIKNEQFFMIIDQHSDRIKLLESAAKTMFGHEPARCLIEPPFQVESHLYQTIQAADWVATIVGRLLAHRVATVQFADWAWAQKQFESRIDRASTHSVLWRPRPRMGAAPQYRSSK
jgi:Protein of unknown function (DUF3800)